MRKVVDFIKTTAIGGFLIIVPIVIILLVLAQLFYSLYAIAESLISTLQLQVDDALLIVAIAALALIGLCFLTGIVVRTRLGLVLKGWLRRHVGKRIPMYNALSSLTKRFAGHEGSTFTPVEVDLYNSQARVIAFKIENLPDQRCAVFVPSAPVATVGNVYVLPRDSVTPIAASVTDTLAAITQWGVDTKNLYTGEAVEKIKPQTDDEPEAN